MPVNTRRYPKEKFVACEPIIRTTVCGVCCKGRVSAWTATRPYVNLNAEEKP